VTFDRLDVPFVVLVLGGGNLAAFDRSQDRGLFDAACRRGRCQGVAPRCCLSLPVQGWSKMQPQWLTTGCARSDDGQEPICPSPTTSALCSDGDRSNVMPRRPRSLGRDQTSAGRNYPTTAPPNYRIDFSKSWHGVAPGSLPDAIRSLQHSRTVSNLTHYPTIDGGRLRFWEWHGQ
jgi:hypothetical protein